MEDLYPNGEGISLNVLPWPSQSPDLSPIENLLHIMDHKMKARKPQNETQLFESCQEAWEIMDIDYLQSLV
jgi:hypothetical protein